MPHRAMAATSASGRCRNDCIRQLDQYARRQAKPGWEQMILDGSIAEISAALRTRDTSARELAQASIDRIAALDGTLGAFLATTPELALEAADRADAALKA